MKISLFTPTHNPKFIYELWETIKSQTLQDFEWVIVTNNGAQVDIKDPRVKIINTPSGAKSVGALKKFACENCSGDILAEVDHDDLLVETCLEKVRDKFIEDPEIGFVYSGNAKLGEFKPYGANYGWEHRGFEYNGQLLLSPIPFEPSAHSFSFIWYAPDHIRAWRKDIYMEIGGHNPDYEILDDQELLIRTYLKTKIGFIDEVLYIYRITGDNTWIERNKAIQEGTVNLQKQYAYQLAERWADINKLEKIDLGGGFNSPAGYKSVDLKNADIIADLNKGIPLPDNSVGVVRAHDILEHLPDKQFIMAEIHRVLADGGWLMAQIPSTDGRGAFQDPTHISYWNENSIWYWTREALAKYIYNDKIKFQEFRLETVFPTDYHRENNIPYVVANLAAIKSDKRRPHLKLI